MNNRYAIIMAGGIGSRFWPLSRSERPKQFLDILGTGETLLQQTFRRLKSVCPVDNIFVVTNSDHENLVKGQLEIRQERILSEPYRRNTAPCIAYGTFVILNENPDAVIAITPADHIITKEEEFSRNIIRGFDFASTENALITLGIIPDRPETGYGYIQADKKNNIKGPEKLYRVKAFTEKPEIDLAKSFIKSGDYYWNAGIFIWSVKSILKALDDYLPDICSAFMDGKSFLGTKNEEDFINRIYYTFPNISIDYGVLEKANNVYVLCVDMGWSDLGTWSSLYGHSKTDQNKNAIVNGKAFSYECKGNIVSIPEGKIALLEGLNGYIVVDTNNALLIIRKEEEQKIKQYLEEIKVKIKDQIT
jgi:mannose-1-phosphate guanylyltransferase